MKKYILYILNRDSSTMYIIKLIYLIQLDIYNIYSML